MCGSGHRVGNPCLLLVLLTLARTSSCSHSQCEELLISSLQWRCGPLAQATAQKEGRLQLVQGTRGTQVGLCRDSVHDNQAVLHIREPAESPRAADTHSVYRVRAVGPQVVLVHMVQCGHGLYLGGLRVQAFGKYELDVMQTFQNFTILSWQAEQEAEHIARVTFQVAPTPAAPTRALDDGSWLTSPGTPICSTFPLQGMWVSRQPADPCITALLTTSRNMTHSPFLSKQFNDDILHWRPKQSCRLRTWAEMAERGCLANRHVCFVGDSQLRNLHNGWSTSWPRIQAGQAQPSRGIQDNELAVDDVVPGPHSSYMIDVWGDQIKASNLGHCTDVIVNFGHWPMSKHGKPPWTLRSYAAQVDKHLAEMAQLKAQNKRVFWMTMHAFPGLQVLGQGQLTVDRRVEPWMYLYNQAAKQAARRHGVLLLNTWDLTNVLSDTSYDFNHFPTNSTVGWALNNYFLNYLCHVAA